MNNKNALVITSHVKNSILLGGFHYFVKYLTGAGYDVDWVTNPVSITWLFRHEDKANPSNFLDLWRGISWQENDTTIRHFAVPVWIPAKVAKMLGMKLGVYFWPRWEKLRKRLRLHTAFDIRHRLIQLIFRNNESQLIMNLKYRL